MNRNIYINISDIASYIGQNKWNYTLAFDRLWKKCDKDYDIYLNELNSMISMNEDELILIDENKLELKKQLKEKKITKKQFNTEVKKVMIKENEVKQVLQDVENKVDNINLTPTQKVEKHLGEDINKIISNKSTETDDKHKIINKSIHKLIKDGVIDEKKKDELLKQTSSLINTTHGILKEQSAIDIFEQQYNCSLDISQKYFKLLVMKSNNINWYIGGKLDGIHKDYIVEVKNRIYGFMSYVREYENTQIQLYLLLTNYDNAKLVQKYKNTINITDIKKDQIYIDQILNYVKIFIKNMERFLANKELKREYIRLLDDSDREKFLNELYISEIVKKSFEDDELNRNEDEVCLIDSDSDF